jgi:hypothetical protein
MALRHLSAWWQGLLLILVYAGLYVLFSFVQARVFYGDGRQGADAAMLDLVEGVIRRRVAGHRERYPLTRRLNSPAHTRFDANPARR